MAAMTCRTNTALAPDPSPGSCHNQQATEYTCARQQHKAHVCTASARSDQHLQPQMSPSLYVYISKNQLGLKPVWDQRRPFGNSNLLQLTTAAYMALGPVTGTFNHITNTPPTLRQNHITNAPAGALSGCSSSASCLYAAQRF